MPPVSRMGGDQAGVSRLRKVSAKLATRPALDPAQQYDAVWHRSHDVQFSERTIFIQCACEAIADTRTSGTCG